LGFYIRGGVPLRSHLAVFGASNMITVSGKEHMCTHVRRNSCSSEWLQQGRP
jgi:hypothetical protein